MFSWVTVLLIKIKLAVYLLLFHQQVFTKDILTKFPEAWCTLFKNISLDSLNGIPECRSEVSDLRSEVCKY